MGTNLQTSHPPAVWLVQIAGGFCPRLAELHNSAAGICEKERELKGKNPFNDRFHEKPTVLFSKGLSQRNRDTDQGTLPSSAEISGFSSIQEIPVIQFTFFIHHTLIIASPLLYLMFGWRNNGLIQGGMEDMLCCIYGWSNILLSIVVIHGRKFRMTQLYIVFTLRADFKTQLHISCFSTTFNFLSIKYRNSRSSFGREG